MSNCTGGVKWIETVFGECVVNVTDNTSFYLGLLSSLISLISSLPQIIQNCRTTSVDGQSPFFFLLLLVGDVASLVGLLVNGGLITQFIQAVIFVILDGILVIQYVLYAIIMKKFCNKKEDLYPNEKSPNEKEGYEGDQSHNFSSSVFTVGATAAVNYASPYTNKELAGTIFGWISAIIYTSSRFPQLYKNFVTSQVGDINPLYIVFSFLGNFAYCLSIFVKSIDPQWCWEQTPWIVGAAGPCLCDILLLIQMIIYGLHSGKEVENQNSDSDERMKRTV